MRNWLRQLKHDPRPALLSARCEALRYFARRDLLDEAVGPLKNLWDLPEARRILARQDADGAWTRTGPHKHPAINHRLIETWRRFRFLVEQFGFTHLHPQAGRAAGFILSCQSEEGDIRGILANQYATYYTGAILALLVQAGYADDPRIEKGFQWLLGMRQDDGGWTVPLITHKLDRRTQYRLTSEFSEPLQPDRSKPFSHNWTGMVLRLFAVHPRYRRCDAAVHAAGLLKSRFFQPDSYTSYQDAGYWLRFEHPFWWNNLVTALDSLSLMGFPAHDPDVQRGLQWLVDHQQKNGLWRQDYRKAARAESASARARETRLWITLAVCRLFKRFAS